MEDGGIFMSGGKQGISRLPIDPRKREVAGSGRIWDKGQMLGVGQSQPMRKGFTAVLQGFPVGPNASCTLLISR